MIKFNNIETDMQWSGRDNTAAIDGTEEATERSNAQSKSDNLETHLNNINSVLNESYLIFCVVYEDEAFGARKFFLYISAVTVS